MSGRSGGPKLTCAAADATLPIGAVTLFALIADLLVTAAFVHAFPPGARRPDRRILHRRAGGLAAHRRR
jgi:hypothetical protein